MRSPAWTSASSRVASTGERKYVRSLVVAGAGWRRTVTGSVPGHMTGRRVVPGGDRRPPESCVIARAGTSRRTMHLPRTFLTTAALALALPGRALAAAPWTDPVPVGTGGTPAVIGDPVAFNAPGSSPGTPLLRSVDGAPATTWNTSGADFDAAFGAFAGDLYVGSNGARHVIVGRLKKGRWTVSAHGPRTGGARVAAAPGAAVFSTFEAGGVGHVYLVREGKTTQRLSARGHIRSVAVATNTRGDVLAAWDRRGTIEYREWRSGRLTSLKTLGRVSAAMHLSVALGADGRAIVAWVDQPINEGSSGVRAKIVATARRASAGFLAPKVLETYPDLTVIAGIGVKAAYTSSGRGLIAWSGRDAVKASFVHSRVIEAAKTLAPIPADGNTNDGLTDVAVSPSNGAAVVIS